jgi:hypothetical protein
MDSMTLDQLLDLYPLVADISIHSLSYLPHRSRFRQTFDPRDYGLLNTTRNHPFRAKMSPLTDEQYREAFLGSELLISGSIADSVSSMMNNLRFLTTDSYRSMGVGLLRLVCDEMVNVYGHPGFREIPKAIFDPNSCDIALLRAAPFPSESSLLNITVRWLNCGSSSIVSSASAPRTKLLIETDYVALPLLCGACMNVIVQKITPQAVVPADLEVLRRMKVSESPLLSSSQILRLQQPQIPLDLIAGFQSSEDLELYVRTKRNLTCSSPLDEW